MTIAHPRMGEKTWCKIAVWLWNHFIVFVGCASIFGLIYAGVVWKARFVSEGVYAITAIVILWYTWETSQIRRAEKTIAEASEEALNRAWRPSVGCVITTDPNIPHETYIEITNQSNYAVAVRINCNFCINGNPIQNFSPDLSGDKYWNLQLNGKKWGHFSWLNLFLHVGMISSQQADQIKNSQNAAAAIQDYLIFQFNLPNPSSNPPELTMDLEVYCENERNLFTYYPKVHYKYDFNRLIWIPNITSDEPYWQLGNRPSWVAN